MAKVISYSLLNHLEDSDVSDNTTFKSEYWVMLAQILQAIYQSEHHKELKFHEIMSSKRAKRASCEIISLALAVFF